MKTDLFEGADNCYDYLTNIRNNFKERHTFEPSRIHMGQSFYDTLVKHLLDNHINAKMNNYSEILLDGIVVVKDKSYSPVSYMIG